MGEKSRVLTKIFVGLKARKKGVKNVGDFSSKVMVWTPAQEAYWEGVKDRPVFKELVDRLGLEASKTVEQDRNERIAARVEGWVDQLGLAPVERMRVILPRASIFGEVDLSWVKEGDCPF